MAGFLTFFEAINMPYRIGFLLGSLTGAGAEKTILTLAKNLSALGHSVDLYLLDTHGDYPQDGGINYIGVSGNKKTAKRQHLRTLTENADYDLFVTSRADFYHDISVANKYCSVHITPTAWLKQHPLKFWKYPLQVRKLKRKFSHKRLIALSEGIKTDLVNNLGCASDNVMIINNPFETDRIRALANEPGAIPDGDYIVYVASMIPRKRHADLFHAFSRLKNQNVRLLLVGQGHLRHELEDLAKSLGIQERVDFWGWDINPYRLVKAAKVSVLASEAEGLPRAVVESLLLSTPTVSTDCPSGPAEVMTDKLADYLVPVGDVDALKTSIDKALESYPDIDQDRLSRFDAVNVAKRYERLISCHN
ncbi:N-acetylgalactosamine-N,N '-diacetylbacillosaminyl-diphospho-undecaprenol 4-alpha-N-acetylgalactosaminyltransferase [BD1-7 clade bacterium]|uniref:N-acetylgalactosamine-N,N '-diacetylbacillosaminyl-diphospho-undecaprenol 4-alpha-N-acetylgalactosaminyltransferase n=1 Tax=BD1-7 clade bacterium TaxID=2029982 RepID=A0A5S9N0M8_9GAMM|nr:N-acetylgalactosamine-N,N '-diacetylbacillosaminyl-diphospho-undecaprenol 4-alpha-N-acetylgalactosaminyltransferase [BD1-7 clade bacterium]CAA0082533.1 N-acetylgalactosamine-N,N '-diacetylbacillosaminyl-diphospho-undecaprenol 4-alpha-N-acetylgalactosaminyltransferase [BD1-7 clade bacterium]